MIKKLNITDILTAGAVLAGMTLYGGEEWYFCIPSIAMLLAACFFRIKSVIRNKYGILFVFMIFSAVFALCFSDADKHKGICGFEILICFFCAFYVGESEGDSAGTGKYIFIGAFVSAVIGLCAYCGFIHIDEFIISDRGIRRLQSVFRYANTAAVVFGCGYYMSPDISDDKNIGIRLMSLMTLAAVYLTFSKAAIAVFLGIGVILVFLRRDMLKRFVIDNGICVISAAVIFYLYILYSRDVFSAGGTMIKRLVYMRDALGALRENMVSGAGSGAWRYLQYTVQSDGYSVSHIHNGWLELWLENGLVFIICMLLLTVSAVVAAVKRKKYTAAASILLTAFHSLVDFDLSFGSVLIVYGLMLGMCLNTEEDFTYKRIRLLRKYAIAAANICILTVFSAVLVYMCAEYAVRISFENSYIEQRYNEAVKKAYTLEKLCPYDSELRISIAALDGTNAEKEIENAMRLSPLDGDIVRAMIEYRINTGGRDVTVYLRKFISMAPKQEKVYALSKEYAADALRKGLCSEEEYNQFTRIAEEQRIAEGVLDRNKLLETKAMEK